MKRLSIPLGLACLAALLSTIFVLSLPGRLYWQRVVQDGGHGVVFAAVAVVLLLMRPTDAASHGRRPVDFVFAIVVAVGLGIATELLQFYLPNRHVSALDVLHDAAGAALGLAVMALLWPPASSVAGVQRVKIAGWAVAIGALLLLGWEPVRCAIAYSQRSAAYPVLAPLERPAAAHFVATRNSTLKRAPLPATWRRDGEPDALEIRFAAGTRPALELVEPVPDWSSRTALVLDLTNPSGHPAHFVLRVLDEHHDWTHEDRLNLRVTIAPHTRTTVRVATAAIAQAPARREMDLSAIANVMLFAPVLLDSDTFYVSRIWLED